MVIEPQTARYTMEASAEGLRSSIPARRNWFVLLFLMAWLGGWAFGEVNAISELLNPNDKTSTAFLLFWLAGWTLGGAFCIATVLWQLAGKEVFVVNASELMHRIELFGLGRTRIYRSSDIKNLRVTEYSPS